MKKYCGNKVFLDMIHQRNFWTHWYFCWACIVHCVQAKNIDNCVDWDITANFSSSTEQESVIWYTQKTLDWKQIRADSKNANWSPRLWLFILSQTRRDVLLPASTTIVPKFQHTGNQLPCIWDQLRSTPPPVSTMTGLLEWTLCKMWWKRCAPKLDCKVTTQITACGAHVQLRCIKLVWMNSWLLK